MGACSFMIFLALFSSCGQGDDSPCGAVDQVRTMSKSDAVFSYKWPKKAVYVRSLSAYSDTLEFSFASDTFFGKFNNHNAPCYDGQCGNVREMFEGAFSSQDSLVRWSIAQGACEQEMKFKFEDGSFKWQFSLRTGQRKIVDSNNYALFVPDSGLVELVIDSIYSLKRL